MSDDLLGPPKTAGYNPHPIYLGPSFTSLRRLPAFNLSIVRDMLYDPRIKFGLWLIKGPILAKRKFEVEADREEVAEFVNETIDRFWNGGGAAQALRCVEFGYSCNEVMYEVVKGVIQYKELRPIYPTDAVALELRGEFAGALVSNIPGKDRKVFLGGPKCFWPVHDSDFSKYYGCPRLLGAFPPWVEKWHEGGFRDTRKLFFYKYAFNGGSMEYPPGSTPVTVSGQDEPIMVPNQELARDVINSIRAGGNVTMPYQGDINGNNMWRHTPGGTVSGDPSALMDYGGDLDEEIWEGIGIPAEVARAAETGSGYSGRVVPQEAFYAILHMVLCEITNALVKQIVHPLVVLNYGRNGSEFKVRPYGLMQDAASSDAQDMTDVNGEDSSGEGNQPPPNNGRVGPSNKPTRPGKSGVAMSICGGGAYRYGE